MASHPTTSRTKLCQCASCSLHQIFEPVTQKNIAGQWQPISEYQKHQRKEHIQESGRQRRHDITSSAQLVDKAPSNPPTKGKPKSPTGNNATNNGPNNGPLLLPDQRVGHPPGIESTPCITDLLAHRLDDIGKQIDKWRPVHQLAKGLELLFSSPPSLAALANTGNPPANPKLDLVVGSKVNLALIKEEQFVQSALQFLQADSLLATFSPPDQQRHDRFLGLVIKRRKEIATLKHSIWMKQFQDMHPWIGSRQVNTGNHLHNPYEDWHPAVLACYLTVCAVHLFLSISLSGTSTLLTSMKFILNAVNATGQKGQGFSEGIQDGIPKTAETMIRHLELEPKFRSYVVCETCFKMHQLSGDGTYPATCGHRRAPRSQPCNSTLRRLQRHGHGMSSKPIRLYLHHDLEDWVARLYARPDIEKHLDRDLRKDLPANGVMRDICDSPEIQNFLGPDGQIFLKEGREGRLIFSLNMDGFNPHKNMEAGKKASIGGIYMVCLNLPPEIRYDLQNIFLVGVIPGLHAPSKDEINHILEPLVSDLLDIWNPGFYIAATHRYPQGRPIRGAVIPLVCDLPAARQMSGCAGHASNYFCSYCLLKGAEMNTFDYVRWPKRSEDDHRKCAAQWRDAQTEEHREKLYQTNGVRWSELLRLPYWDPTRFVVIDVMHALLLGLLKRHLDPSKLSKEKLDMGRAALAKHHYNRLVDLNQSELRYLCYELNLPYGGRKSTLIGSLMRYQNSLSEGAVTNNIAPTSDEDDDSDDLRPVTILGEATLEEIRQDMAKLKLPTWVSPAPSHPGGAKSGKLTADQWKTFCTVNLVITLNRLWGKSAQPDDEQCATRKRQGEMLENFMHLVSAVKLASMRTMSPERIQQYTEHMHKYLCKLQVLYPWTSITPYQHTALHLPDFLRRFGPTHGWRCFPFERYNYILQSTLTNNRFGDLERTIFKRFCHAQNLRIIMEGCRLPQSVLPLVRQWQQQHIHAKAAVQGTLHDDFSFNSKALSAIYEPGQAKPLPTNWLSLLRQWIRFYDQECDTTGISGNAHIKDTFERVGEQFSSQPHSKNAQVYYMESNGDVCGGIINGIFTHQRTSGPIIKTDTFFILKQFKSSHSNPTAKLWDRSFQRILGRVFLNSTYEGLVIVNSQKLLYHFASYPILSQADPERPDAVELLLAVPLDKW
ncbi:hypothetical protein CVT24_007401 [Panaeolus cyanescens]|uniref:SAP domain-containing protein n=1 Tax=Panaeolus cyanescens TaxID=181874 RepID=A0A409W9T6_9AGAR|nr:hypothetical protein CVT24_007401 [Panaeolus cyanescens]